MLSFYKVWSEPQFTICQDYLYNAFGGTFMTIPGGTINAIITNLGSLFITKIVTKIRFHSTYKQIYTTILLVFLLSYINSGLMILIRFRDPQLPDVFTPRWLVYYGKYVMTSMIVSNFLHYTGPILDLSFRRCCCCCIRKSYKPRTHLN